VVKSLDDFYVKRASKDGLSSNCKECQKTYNKEYRDSLSAEYKQLMVSRTAEYHKQHPDKKAISNSKWKQNNKGKVNAYTAKRFAAKLQRTPSCVLNDPDELWLIEQFYVHARYLTELTGVPHQVDHIYPLQGTTVSGFHCWQNLQILTAAENQSKGNRMPT